MRWLARTVPAVCRHYECPHGRPYPPLLVTFQQPCRGDWHRGGKSHRLVIPESGPERPGAFSLVQRPGRLPRVPLCWPEPTHPKQFLMLARRPVPILTDDSAGILRWRLDGLPSDTVQQRLGSGRYALASSHQCAPANEWPRDLSPHTHDSVPPRRAHNCKN
jgi:hypothetical protein